MPEETPQQKPSLYKRYMKVMGKVGDIQGRAILTILYFTVFAIPGVFLSIFGDRLQTKKIPVSWQERTDNEHNIERAKEQW